MSESTTAPTTVAVDKTSFWEDLIDIFYQPSAVYARRRNASPWPPLLFVVLAIALLNFATFNAIEPAFEGDFHRNLPKMMAQNPQMTQEMADKAMQFQAVGVRYMSGLFIAVAVVVVGFLTWVLGKLFGAVESFAAACLIAAYAYMPRVLGAIIAAVQGLVRDPVQVKSLSSLGVGPAWFLDPDTASPVMMALLARLDLMIIWETVLLSIGIAVIGKLPRGKAIAFGLLIWLLGGIYQIRQAYLLS